MPFNTAVSSQESKGICFSTLALNKTLYLLNRLQIFINSSDMGLGTEIVSHYTNKSQAASEQQWEASGSEDPPENT